MFHTCTNPSTMPVTSPLISFQRTDISGSQSAKDILSPKQVLKYMRPIKAVRTMPVKTNE